LKTSVFNTQKELPLSKSSIQLAVETILYFQKKEADEVAIHFVSQKAIQKLHKDFFDDPTTTDCISFPFDTAQDLSTSSPSRAPIFLGEIFICPKTALDFVALKKGSPYEEVTLYLVHGLMHLLGYDDITPKERLKMRALEKKAMHYLSVTGRLLKPE